MALPLSGLPEQVADEEDLARFLTQSSQFNSLMAKPAAFLPNPKDQETSVFRHGDDPALRLWVIGRGSVGDRKLYGAAIVKTHVIRNVNLNVVADEPPPRHAAIREWPWLENDPELQKAQQKEMASVIASNAMLRLL